MKKLFLSISTMIFTHFVLKVVRRIKHPETSKEETYRAMRDAHDKWLREEERKRDDHEAWLREHQPKRPVAEVDAQLMRGDPSSALASIGTISDLEEALRPCRPVDKADAMAMSPRRFS